MRMFKQILIAAAVAATVSGGAAVAKENTVPASDAARAPSDKTRYCIKSQEVTGTILQRRSCKTLAQWQALGVDPTKKQH